MSKLLLDGIVVANAIKSELSSDIEKLRSKGVVPCLATILVGNDPSSETYVRMKGNACQRLGILSKRIHHKDSITTEILINTIQELNHDPSIHGILLQHPVPSHIDERAAFEAIDVDFESCLEESSAITPVPGGVGPVTIAILLKHTVKSAQLTL